MTHAKALGLFCAIFTCGLLVALVTLPFAALPVAYIGLTLGLTAAAVTTGLASVLLGALAGQALRSASLSALVCQSYGSFDWRYCRAAKP